MSLINKMLNDLERRQAALSGSRDASLDDIYPVSEEEMRRHGERRIHPATILIFGILISGFLLLFLNSGKYRIPEKIDSFVRAGLGLASTRPVVSRPVDTGAGPTSVKAGNGMPARAASIALKLDSGSALAAGEQVNAAGGIPAMAVKGVQLEEYGKLLNIELNLPRETQYLVYTLTEPNRVVLELTGARYDGALPDIGTMEDVRAIRQSMEQGGTYKLVVETGKQMIIDTTNMEKRDAGYILHINMMPEELAVADAPLPQAIMKAPEESRSGTMYITPAASDDTARVREEDNDASRIDRMVHEGRKLYEEGEMDKGLNKLLSAVKQAPGNVNARTTLAVLLFEQGQDDLAKYILTEGLRAHPRQSEWAKILARALYSEGDLDNAQTILEAAAPPVDGHLDYHALYAGILQRKGEHPRAAIVYRNLLRQQPSNGTWWMGLAISLEAMSRKDDAITAYKHALNTPRLSPDSARFVKDRLDHLIQQS